MSLDHYVSQVHLKNFYARELDNAKMFGFRKRDAHIFKCSAKDVCRSKNGSDNPYFKNERIVEEILKHIEPNYNASVQALRNARYSAKSLFVIAGFAAYVAMALPAAMRIAADPLKHLFQEKTKILDRQGVIPKAPDILDGKSFSELLAEGKLLLNIDQRYPQSIMIRQFFERVGIWGNCLWDIIVNEHADSPFFKSDFPVAIEQTRDPRILNRIVPLAPDLAIRIYPNFEAKKVMRDLNFPRFSAKRIIASHDEVRRLNTLIAQCAEELVFFSRNANWVENFLKKHQNVRVLPTMQKFPTFEGTGQLHLFGYKIGPR